jgi:hypothetical protein
LPLHKSEIELQVQGKAGEDIGRVNRDEEETRNSEL